MKYVVHKVFNGSDPYFRLVKLNGESYDGTIGTINGVFYGMKQGTKEECLHFIGNQPYIDWETGQWINC